MNGYKGLTTIICMAALGLGLAACGGGSGTSGMRNPADPGLAESIERATALNVAIEAATGHRHRRRDVRRYGLHGGPDGCGNA